MREAGRNAAILGLVTLVIGGLAPPRAAAEQIPALCSDAANQNAGTACAARLFHEADARLNAVYAELKRKLDGKGRGYLAEAERAWIAFRDTECVLRTGGGPNQQGTIWPMLYEECRVGLTRQRIKDLEKQVRCPGGDLSCPG